MGLGMEVNPLPASENPAQLHPAAPCLGFPIHIPNRPCSKLPFSPLLPAAPAPQPDLHAGERLAGPGPGAAAGGWWRQRCPRAAPGLGLAAALQPPAAGPVQEPGGRCRHCGTPRHHGTPQHCRTPRHRGAPDPGQGEPGLGFGGGEGGALHHREGTQVSGLCRVSPPPPIQLGVLCVLNPFPVLRAPQPWGFPPFSLLSGFFPPFFPNPYFYPPFRSPLMPGQGRGPGMCLC